ncbi:histidine kinase [Solirubrobacter sp. CPCC 204708]|uniref:Histidine kinase n=1 Tax=Solirubrobacter deserti TaxID=2282478 RepID=A0ABT4RT68_9ACTN|nr:histidine kinase [Solirubrobacter deserti]MBE2316447.1 histidine kinase [Solirubrobacter deserti]MDA0141650.1 histidine kinase [Solirubrobacter deserti]
MAGHYKIFLGMAAGVGKTYRMLAEAQAQAEAGRDVVVGLLETHGRAETQRAAEGLEQLPRRRVPYRGVTLEEMDLPGILRRAPELCLIDELAHTNTPGVEHPKRYDDIADVRRAGIDVYSTVNVQHLESLNDQVAELTGVRVRETVPDEELAKADEVVLIDLPPEDLVTRLQDGKVYPPARVPAALNGFFRVENLRALREVALRQVAETVEARRPDAPPIAERLLAFVTLDEAGERVVRRAARSAQRLNAVLDVLLVRDPEAAASADERARLEALRRLAAMVGAHLLVDEGADEVAVLERVARERGTTYVLVGPPGPRRGLGRFAEPQLMRILRALPDVDVRVVADRREQDLLGR